MSDVPRLGLLQLAGREAPALYVIGLLFAVLGVGALFAGVESRRALTFVSAEPASGGRIVLSYVV